MEQANILSVYAELKSLEIEPRLLSSPNLP